MCRFCVEVFSWVASARREVVRVSCSVSFWKRAVWGVVFGVMVVAVVGGRLGNKGLVVGRDVPVAVAVGRVVDDG